MSKKPNEFSDPIRRAAVEVAKAINAQVLFAYFSTLQDPAAFIDTVIPPTRVVLVCRDTKEEEQARKLNAKVLRVPSFKLTRMDQIKMATLLAFSENLLQAGDIFVFLAGAVGKELDTLVTMRVGKEYELFQSVGQPKLTEHIRPSVFQKVLTIALELAHEGREGKPVGGLFVVGDYREVRKMCVEGRINPFRGYTEKERNIMDQSMTDVVKELSKIDGAFIIKGNGVIVSAGTMLRPALAGEEMPKSLGARHSAAAAITASTKCLAITLSESTGTVRLWRRGSMITEIERSPRGSEERQSGSSNDPGNR